MSFDSTILNIMRDTADISLTAVQDVGLLFSARHQVSLVTEILPSENNDYGFRIPPPQNAAGVPADDTDNRNLDITILNPQPLVDLRVQERIVSGVLAKIGDAKIKNISQNNVTRKQLEDADYILIGNDTYDLVYGTIKDTSPGIFFECIVKRREQNDAP